MKKLSPAKLKNELLSSVDNILSDKSTYLENPETDFSRTQKISLRDTMLFPMIASNELTSVELLDYFSPETLPSQSAMSYRRNQLKSTAFEAVLKDFTRKLPCKKSFRGMCLIACDGTRVNTPYNPKDPDSFVNCIKGRKGFNQYHLVTCYDVLNEIFTDVVIQNYYSMNEKAAFCTMLDRYPKDKKVLFLADRGFSSHNVIAHAMNNGHNFLIRLTAPMAHKIFGDTQKTIKSVDVFDEEDTFYVGRVRNKISQNLRNYNYKSTTKPYDYIPVGGKNIDSFLVRLVKFPLPGGEAEYLLTNLPQKNFSLEDLKTLYKMRWGVETAYRYLKYASGMVHMHSIKQKFIFQEIFAKLTLYNFCSAVKVCTTVKNSDSSKHKYVIEKTYLVKSCIRFLKDQLQDIIKLVEKRKVPVRGHRSFGRIIRRRHADTLQYR